MIRFIDLGDQILEGQRKFAWWDTIHDEFFSFSLEQAWETWKEFQDAYRLSFPTTDEIASGNVPNPEELARFKGLFPKEWPPPFVSAEDRKKRHEQGICDDVVDK